MLPALANDPVVGLPGSGTTENDRPTANLGHTVKPSLSGQSIFDLTRPHCQIKVFPIHYDLQWTAGRETPPPKFPFPWSGRRPPSNTWFLGPTRVPAPNGTSVSSEVLAQLTFETNRQTDHRINTVTAKIQRVNQRRCL